MSIRVRHSIGDLASDCRKVSTNARKELRGVVLDGVRAGNELAKGHARRANPPGSHAYLYPGTFSATMHDGRGLFGNVISGEYGPAPRGQGLLGPILENGSRNGNAPQNNLAKSTDVIFPQFPREVSSAAAGLFWPNS